MDVSAAPSLFFFTFHKCASVFFSRCVLQRADALRLENDEYVLKKAGRFLEAYDRAVELVSGCPTTRVLRYEDMVDSWDVFQDQLQTAFDLPPECIQAIEAQSRPTPVERPGSHKRSGATGDSSPQNRPRDDRGIDGTFLTGSSAVRISCVLTGSSPDAPREGGKRHDLARP